MEELTVRFPKRVILELLRQIPKEQLEELIQESREKAQLKPIRVAPESLDILTGLSSVGGDAVQDTETVYE
jgi:hypothetical protein